MNILLYIADALRADHCSVYGYDRDTTPTLRDLSQDGIVVENCFTQATWTRAAAASILTGCYPDTHKTETRSDALPDTVPYLPEALSEAGFKTLGISAMGNVSTPLGFGRGFDEFIELYQDEDVVSRRPNTSPKQEKLRNEDGPIAYPKAEDINNVLLPWLEEHGESDWFVMVWAIDPHDPYDPSSGWEQYLSEYDGPENLGRERGTLSKASSEADFQRLRDLYDCEIRYMDSQFGEIISKLDNLDVYEETTVAFTGDHGESFGERTWRGSPVIAHNTPPFDERLNVPLVIKPASNILNTESINHPAGLTESVDIAPTLAEFGEVKKDQFQGVPLLGDHKKEKVHSKTQQDKAQAAYYSIRTREWKYILIDPPALSLSNFLTHPKHFIEHLLSDNKLLYNITDDPEERNSIRGDEGQSEVLKRELEQWHNKAIKEGKGFSRAQSQRDQAIENQLKALGYIS